jgi:phosphate transport system substrate-binding protein
MPTKQTIKVLGIALLAVCLVASGCGSSSTEKATATPETQEQVVLTVSGSGSVSALLTAVEAEFEAATPGYNLNILSGSGTGGGVSGVLDGTLDVAAMARPPKEEEAAKGLEYVAFGDTGVAILVQSDVEVTDLSRDQVQGIFFGEITNWSEVGGPDADIVVYVRDEDESATVALRQLIFGDTAFPETVAGVLTSSGDMVTAVGGTPNSIGYGNWAGVPASGHNLKSVTLDGIAPVDPSYPMLQSMGIGYVESGRDAAQPLVDWLTSDRGRTVLSELGVILPESGS